MTQTYGRHRGTSSQDRAGNIAAAVIAIAALGGAGVIATQRGGADPGPRSQAAGGVTPSSPPEPSQVVDCPDAARAYTSSDYRRALEQVAEAQRKASGTACRPVTVEVVPNPAALAKSLPKDRAAVWLARTDADVAALPEGVGRSAPRAVASSPVVLAMPSPMADVWGWPTKPITTDVWRSWLLGRTTWASTGHPQWKNFSVRMADPANSPTSAVGFGAMLTIANGGPLTTPPDYGSAHERDLALIKVEHHVSSLAPDDAGVLPARSRDLQQVAAEASAYLTTEKAVADHNATRPKVPLAALPLGGGAASVQLKALRVGNLDGSAGGSAKADAFVDYLVSPAGRTALREAGLRGPDGAAPTDKPAGVAYAAAPLPPQALDVKTVQTAAQTWGAMHTRISSMALIDASGSMNQRFAGSERSRIDLVRGLVGQTYRTASPRARSGVWFFHTAGEAGTPLIERATPLAVNETVEGGKSHSDRVGHAIDSVSIKGGTPLYQAVREAYGYTLSKYDPGYINQLVVLSDGANRDTSSPDQLSDLLAYLQEAQDPNRPVRIICLGYGAEADMGALQAIARATGGRAAQISSPDEMAAAVKFALFSI